MTRIAWKTTKSSKVNKYVNTVIRGRPARCFSKTVSQSVNLALYCFKGVAIVSVPVMVTKMRFPNIIPLKLHSDEIRKKGAYRKIKRTELLLFVSG